MSKSLTDLMAVLARRQPQMADALNPSASSEDIASLEGNLGVTLPPDFVAALKAGNGQKVGLPGIFKGHRFLCIADILSDWDVWKMLNEDGDFNDAKSCPDAGIKEAWWNPRWIPFSNSGSGDHFCLDMDPSPEGRTGQIIFVWHDEPKRRLIASSFSAWVSALCTEAGEQP